MAKDWNLMTGIDLKELVGLSLPGARTYRVELVLKA